MRVGGEPETEKSGQAIVFGAVLVYTILCRCTNYVTSLCISL
jgi:hypothetical protein